MAAAMTLHAPTAGTSNLPLASSLEPRAPTSTGFAPWVSDRFNYVEGVASTASASQCEGCKSRHSRCAVNLDTKKCYSCDFHRQDCVFTADTSKKRSCPHPADNTGKKSSHARNRSLSSSFKDLLQSPVRGSSGAATSNTSDASRKSGSDSSSYLYLRGAARLDPLLLEYVPFSEGRNEASLQFARFRRVRRQPGEFTQVLDPSTTTSARQDPAAQYLETIPRADLDFLVHRFFDVVHPVFPILDEQDFCCSYDRKSVEPLLLAAVCLVAGAWSTSSGSLPKEMEASIAEVTVYEQLRSALERPNTIVLQSGLLLLQHPDQSYQQLSSQVVCGAFDLGLHQDCAQWMIPQHEKCARRRLAWALYAHDKWQAFLHGRPAQMTGPNWLVKPLEEADFESAPSSEATTPPQRNQSAHLFIEVIILSQLLAEILDTFYTLSAEHEVRENTTNGLGMVLELAKPVQIRLKDWFANLAPSLRMSATKDEGSACNGVLHLAYFATEVALHRCIVRASAVPGTDPYLANICRSAAKTRLISALDFVNRLRPSCFTYAWPFASVSSFGLVGTFGVLLQATAPTEEEAGFYHARLNEYRWTLTVNRRSATFLDSAILVLNNSVELLQHGPNKPGIAQLVSTNPGLFPNGQPPLAPIQSSLARPFVDLSSPDSFSSSSEHDADTLESE